MALFDGPAPGKDLLRLLVLIPRNLDSALPCPDGLVARDGRCKSFPAEAWNVLLLFFGNLPGRRVLSPGLRFGKGAQESLTLRCLKKLTRGYHAAEGHQGRRPAERRRFRPEFVDLQLLRRG